MVDLRQRDGGAAAALEFAILTAARTGEVIGALCRVGPGNFTPSPSQIRT
jgi:hypothetical protein